MILVVMTRNDSSPLVSGGKKSGCHETTQYLHDTPEQADPAQRQQHRVCRGRPCH